MTPEEAVLEAVRGNRVERLEKLLKRFIHCDLLETLRFPAIEASYESNCVDVLLPKMCDLVHRGVNPEKLEYLDRIVVQAAGAGHLEVVQAMLLLLQKERLRHKEHLSREDPLLWMSMVEWKVLDQAAANGHIEIVTFAARYAFEVETEKSFFRAYKISKALTTAISGGHADVVKFLLEHRLHNWKIIKAVEQAMAEGQTEVMKTLYQAYPRYSGGGGLLVDTSRCGHLDAVKYLSNADYVSAGSIELAVAGAAGQGITEIVAYFLDTRHISSEAIHQAFVVAARRGSVVMLKFLFYRGLIKPESVLLAFETTRELVAAKFLFEIARIPAISIVAAVRYTLEDCFFANDDHHPMLQFLLDEKTIPSELVDALLMVAIETNSQSSVQLIVDDRRLTTEGLKNAFTSAASRGFLDIVKFLCNEKMVSSEALSEAFVCAAANRRREMVMYFCDKERIAPQTICTALNEAAMRGSFDVVAYLVQKPEVSYKTKHEAFVNAAGSNQIEVVKYMYQNMWCPIELLKRALQASTLDELREFVRKKLAAEVDGTER